MLMEGDGPGQIHIREGVAADDDEGLVEKGLSVLDAARGTQGAFLHEIGEVDPERGAIAEIGLDLPGHVLQRHADLGDAVALEQANRMLHDRAVHDGNHGFRDVAGEGAQTRPLASSHDDRFHTLILSQTIDGSMRRDGAGYVRRL